MWIVGCAWISVWVSHPLHARVNLTKTSPAIISKNLPIINLASGATPMFLPSALPPAIVPAQCVPCPWASLVF